MARGGARNRSGPTADPNSERSERRGYVLTALPPEGYMGEVPDWPLGENVSEDAGERELAAWADAWRTPQACAWSMEPWRWPIVAEYCRLKAAVEMGSPAAFIGQIHRYRDQLGLTPAGLKDNGWKIAADDKALVTSAGQNQKAPAGSSSRSRAAASGQFEVIAGGKRAG